MGQGSPDQNGLVQNQAFRSGPRTKPDQDQKIREIQDQLGPGLENFKKSRTEPDQDQQKLENLGPARGRTSKMAVRRSVDGPRSEILILNVSDTLDIYPVRSRPKRPGQEKLQSLNLSFARKA